MIPDRPHSPPDVPDAACIDCGSPDVVTAAPDERCSSCLRDHRYIHGLCVDCGTPCDQSGQRCAACLSAIAENRTDAVREQFGDVL